MVKKQVCDCTLKYLTNTTIHGFPILVAPKLHVLERLFWLTIILCAVAGSIALSIYSWRRFMANPTVVSIEKDYRNWKNPFPAATGCFLRKIDDFLAYNYIEEKWGINETHPKFDYYLSFIKAVANVSFTTMFDLEPFENDKELNSLDMLEIATKVHPELSGKLVTFDRNRKTDWKLIMSEYGICFTINSKFSELMSLNSSKAAIIEEARNFDDKILRCHYLVGLCYAKFDSDPLAPLKFYIHSYLDVVHSNLGDALYIHETEELEINFRMQETTSDPNLRSLTPKQRKCRFYDEPIMKEIPFYSTSLCYIGCRYNIIKKICGCRPFFYHFLEGNLCNISGLLCIAYQAEFIIKSPLEVGCECPQPCDIITYLPEIPKVTVWKYGYFDQRITFRWGLLAPTTKYQRDILFGLDDLIVSFGGIYTLCLGVSFISIVEVLFFLLELIITCANRNKTEPETQRNEKKSNKIVVSKKNQNSRSKKHKPKKIKNTNTHFMM